MVNGNEELPYPKKYLDHGYSNSKREAEQEIIKAKEKSFIVGRNQIRNSNLSSQIMPPKLKARNTNKSLYSKTERILKDMERYFFYVRKELP